MVSGRPLSDETARLFWLGGLIHAGVQSGLGTEDFAHEVPVAGSVASSDGLVSASLSGRIDTLRLNPLEVVELKSIRSKAFDYPLPQPAHVLQVSCYLMFPIECPCNFWPACPVCLGTFKLHPTTARIVYISKDGDKVSEYLVQKDAVLVEAVKEQVLRLEEGYQRYLKDGTLPAPLGKVPLVRKGQVVRYARSGAWGAKGTPKMVPNHRVLYCDYRGTGKCCGDKP